MFQKSCFQCHGKGGSNKGAFASVLNHAELVQTKVKPGDPKCQSVGCASDIDPDPFYSKWRYRESDPITKF